MRKTSRTNGNLQLRPTDPDHCFFLRKSGLWLHRILGRFPRIDDSTATLLEEVLGEEAFAVAEELLQNELGDACSLPGEVEGDRGGGPIQAALEIMKRECSRERPSRVLDRLRRAVRERCRGLAYRGLSESERGLAALRKVFRLDAGEAELCAFLFTSDYFQPASAYFSHELCCGEVAGRWYLRCALGLSQEELTRAIERLSRLEILGRCGSALNLDSEVDELLSQGSTAFFRGRLFRPLPRRGPAPHAAHIPPAAARHIRDLLQERGRAAHILLYGPPGTGKTTFAHGLLAGLGAHAFEILRDDGNSAKRRRSAIRVCLNCENRDGGVVLLVDEADGLLNTGRGWLFSGETHDKGWLNELMDEPGVRIVWIANEVQGIDPSVMRRFTFSQHFAPFSRQQRAEVWATVARRHRVKRLLPAEALEALAARYDVSAGVIDLAVRAAAQSGTGTAKAFLDKVQLGLESHEQLRNGGHRRERKGAVEWRYSLEGLNLNTDPAALVEQVRGFERVAHRGEHQVSLNLLFSGPQARGRANWPNTSPAPPTARWRSAG